ncbi:MAG: 6-bladed beta-propeller [Mariniphaga sp.]
MKNKVKYSLILFCLALMLWNCSGDEKETIELEATQSDTLFLTYNSRIVKLETTPESLLGYIMKVVIDLPSKRIFVLSNFNIFIFDTNGMYLNKLKVGKGPNEINSIMAFTINFEKKLIFAIDNAIKLCLFNYDGNMINKYDITNFASTDICILDDDNVFLARNFVGAEEKYFVGMFNLPSGEVIKKFIPANKSPYPRNTIATAKNFSNNNGHLYFYSTNIFGLFEYEGSNFHQILSLNIGKLAVPPRVSSKFEESRQCDLRDEAKSLHYAPFMLYGFKFKGNYLIGIDDKDINCYAINSTSKKVFHNGTLSSYFNLPDKKSLKLITGVQNDLIIFNCNPSDFFDSKTQGETKEIQIHTHKIKINRNDNPFLMIIE